MIASDLQAKGSDAVCLLRNIPVLYCTIYCTVQQCTVQCTVQYSSVLYNIQFSSELYIVKGSRPLYNVHYSIALYKKVQCFVQCMFSSVLYSIERCFVLCTLLYSTTHCNTVQYSKVQCSTVFAQLRDGRLYLRRHEGIRDWFSSLQVIKYTTELSPTSRSKSLTICSLNRLL